MSGRLMRPDDLVNMDPLGVRVACDVLLSTRATAADGDASASSAGGGYSRTRLTAGDRAHSRRGVGWQRTHPGPCRPRRSRSRIDRWPKRPTSDSADDDESPVAGRQSTGEPARAKVTPGHGPTHAAAREAAEEARTATARGRRRGSARPQGARADGARRRHDRRRGPRRPRRDPPGWRRFGRRRQRPDHPGRRVGRERRERRRSARAASPTPRPTTSPSAWAASRSPGPTASRSRWAASGSRSPGEAHLTQGGARTILAQDVRVDQGLIGTAIAGQGHVRAADRACFLLLAGRRKDRSGPLLDWRGALAFGAAFGLLVGLFRRRVTGARRSRPSREPGRDHPGYTRGRPLTRRPLDPGVATP